MEKLFYLILYTFYIDRELKFVHLNILLQNIQFKIKREKNKIKV